MIIEHLESLLRQEAEERAARPNNPFRASSAGRCIREGCFDLLGLKGEPLQPRRMLVLKGGSTIHDDLLTPLLKKALDWRFVDGAELGDNHVEIDGAKISYHIDGAFQWNFEYSGVDSHSGDSIPVVADQVGIVEIKSMSDYAFNRALKGIIDHEYLCQAWCYFKGTSFNPVVFVAYRKETSAMVEIIFDRSANEKVTTQTLTGDPIALAKSDPILLVEIRTPFDESVEGYVRQRIRWLKEIRAWKESNEDLASFTMAEIPGADAVEDEVENVHGKAKLQEAVEAAGGKLEVTQSGSWYSFKTGRQILGYPCSYCAFKSRCYPAAEMEMKGDKPIWVVSK